MEPDQQAKAAEKENSNQNEENATTVKPSEEVTSEVEEKTATQQNEMKTEEKKECDKSSDEKKQIISEQTKEGEDDKKALPVNSENDKHVDSVDKSEQAEPNLIAETSCNLKENDNKVEESPVPSSTLQLEAIEKSEVEDKSNVKTAIDDEQMKSTEEKNDSVAVASSEIVEAKSSTDGDEEMTSVNEALSTTTSAKEKENEDTSNADIPSSSSAMPNTVVTPVAGSNDVKIEIPGSSLFDRVIKHALNNNNVVDSSRRLDAARNKYLKSNGNVNSSFNSNSNGSDSNSNSSSKSVDKLIEEFKGNCKSDEQQKSDNSTETSTNGADSSKVAVNSSEQIKDEDVKMMEISNNEQSPLVTSQQQQQEQQEQPPLANSTENEALDFREKNELESSQPPPDTAMLDLSVKRDEKSVPPIKRSHALYVGLPDFSKQIFTAPSITRTTNAVTSQAIKASAASNNSNNSVGPPKVRNPDFSSATPRHTPELQMRNPDFSKGFSSAPQPANVSVNPSNFPEIIKKNNYISDLQLKPPTNVPSSTASSSTSSYKIDYRPSTIQPPQSSTSTSPYPNMKKESIYNYNNQHLIDEPMAHVIPKNQFNSSMTSAVAKEHQQQQQQHHGWAEHHKLLGGSSHYDQQVDRKIPLAEHQNQLNSNEDLRKLHPAHYPHPHRMESQSEFLLRQKEQQLRQEGTIITIKNETATRPPTKEITERRSADLFRDYKLKQPKESPDTATTSRRLAEPPPLAYHQQYPDFPANYPRISKPESSSAKLNSASPVQLPTSQTPEYPPQMARNYHTPSPSHAQHRQPKSPLTVPPPFINPPQNWIPPPPLVLRHSSTSSSSGSPMTQMYPSSSTSSMHPSSTPPNYYPQHMGKSSRSPSQSPSPHFIHPNLYTQMPQAQKIPNHHYKYPENHNNRMEMKDNRQNSYYSHKQPDFSRRFEHHPEIPPQQQQQQQQSHHRAFVPVEPSRDLQLQRLPVRQDLEIRTVRHPPSEQYNSNAQYRANEAAYLQHPQPPHHDGPKIHPRMPSAEEYLADRSRIPPDLKIERRMEDNKSYQVPLRHPPPEAVPELSIIPKVKTETPVTSQQNPLPSTSNVIKSTKSLFAEVKRESPLDLSVKTVKTKADSTGGEQDFQSRHHHRPEVASSLKIEFSPNFGNVSKTDCRQQARLGPQENNIVERTVHVGPSAPARFSNKDHVDHSRSISAERLPLNPHASQAAPPPLMPPSNKNHHYQQKFHPSADIERSHPPAPSASDYYKQQQISHRPQAGPSLSASNYHKEIPPQSIARPYPPQSHHMQTPPQSAQYPVINKPSHAAKPNHPMNSKDPHFFGKQGGDRKFVEDILYGRNRREIPYESQQQPPQHQQHLHPRQFAPIPSPPRKRHLEAAAAMYTGIPTKQGRIDEIPKPFGDPRFSNSHNDPQQKMHPIPPNMRHENYPPSHNNNNIITKHYPDPRKDAIKSAEMYNNNNSHGYYPNPKAEMIQRSDPNAMNKFYYKEATPQPYPPQNFQQRPDDGIFPINSRAIPHPHAQLEKHAIKVEHQQTTGPMSELLAGDKAALNGILLPSSMSGSNGNIARGAEQSTIQKLKSNLEFKEQQKLKIQRDDSGEMQQNNKKDLSPRQFRTKAEMKGYTMPIEPVKFEVNRINIDSPSTTATATSAPSAFDLLDWGSACNDFVNQLQTGNKKRGAKKKRVVKNEEDKSNASGIPGTCDGDLSQVPKEILNAINKGGATSSDEDKPLQQLIEQQDSSDKFSRNFREKQRQETEQKFAARLGRPSSSESETDTRKIAKGIKRVRRLRKREALGIKKTDDEHSKEEGEGGETDEDAHIKRRSSKSISKLDDLTSSDEEEEEEGEGGEKKKKESNKKSNEGEGKKENKKKSVDAKAMTASTQKLQQESSDSSETSSSEHETMEDKINKLSTAKNVKKLKDLGDKSNIKNLLEEQKTMTRSKRKLENEKKLSNSKVLRNEKVVQNVSPRDKKPLVGNKGKSLSPLKRKDSRGDESKRKANESDNEKESDGNKLKNGSKKQRKNSSKNDEEEEQSASEESEVEEENRAERLRPRKPKVEVNSEVPTKAARKKIESESLPSTSDAKQARKSLADLFTHREDKASHFKPGWERETYHYKRSLKIPPGLITIGRCPPQHGISHSLPDLDPQTSDTSEIFSEFVKSKDKEGSKDDKTKKPTAATVAEKKAARKKPSSIIDLLHNRVLQSKKKFANKKKSASAANSASKDAANDGELLPTPEKESEKLFGIKKNIFETSILSTRTRTENNAHRKKEMLKEVFGADQERPRSAPPSTPKEADEGEVPEETDKKISYDQKFREYLEKMNVDFLDKKKPELDSTKCGDDDDDFDDNETIAASEKDLVTPTLNKGKAKKNRPRRCKGSSGFDYIRKKKKPTTNASENPMSVNNIIKKRLAAMESLETKNESDICKEIKGWVRNKSVGESILHKASRLNYVDVVAYCLDRLGMDPDTKDNAGYTPLHEACSRGHLEIARLLLQFGGNHSETALSGIRPLHEAIENGHIEIVRLLLSYGADPCLATYSGQLPISLAEDKEMENFLHSYLLDIYHKEGSKRSWYFNSAYNIEDPDEIGYDVFDEVPIQKMDLGSSVASVFSTSMTSLITATTQMSDNETVISETTTATSTPMKTPMKAPLPSTDLIKYQHKMKKCDTNSNNLVVNDNAPSIEVKNEKGSKRSKNCSVILNNNIDSTMKKIKKLPAIVKTETPMIIKSPTTEVIHKLDEIKHKDDYDDMLADENLESDCEFFEVEESEAPLPPLYLLRDEGTDKWILLSDLCNLLKVKSKDAVLKQIAPSSPPSQNKDLIRELKMSDFLERATCLQLFCAGEKLNVRASKVSLVRYNENVKNLLGVQTFKLGMNM